MMNKLMLSCQAATELMEKKHQGELSFKQRMHLFFHTAMCSACRQYEKQSLFLEHLFKVKEETPPVLKPEPETKNLEEKILLKLDERLD